MPISTHYPDYSVLREEHEWDPHTQKIVRSRMGPFGEPQTLNRKQIKTLRSVLIQLTADDRPEILGYLVNHLDTQVTSPIGQAERKVGIPLFSKLLLFGLGQIESYSIEHHGNSFDQLTPNQQHSLLQSVAQGSLQSRNSWEAQHQREFFTQLLSHTVSAYYSHPWIWSEIGYAGPAYPRGYMRVELGLSEPWEAKRHGE